MSVENSCSDKSPLRFFLPKADKTSTGVIADDKQSCRRSNEPTWAEPRSLTYRFTKALVSK